MTPTTSRRTLIAALGLAPVAALGAETFQERPEGLKPDDVLTTNVSSERLAASLQKLADEAKRGAMHVQSVKLEADINHNSLADEHTMTIRFIYLADKV